MERPQTADGGRSALIRHPATAWPLAMGLNPEATTRDHTQSGVF
jgi:hypothetical protein